MNIAIDLRFALRRLRSRVVNAIHGVPAIDLPTLIRVCLVFLVMLLLSCLLLARRASAVAPHEALI